MKTPLNIWHISSNRWNSAITEYALSSVRALQLKKFKTFFSPLKNSPAESRAKKYKIETRSIGTFSIKSLPLILKWLQEIKPDVVMTYGGPETTLIQFALNFMPIGQRPSVIRFRGQDINEKSFFEKCRNNFSHRKIDLVISPSATLTRKLNKISSRIKVATVPLGCDTDVFCRKNGALNFHLGFERPEITVLGRLDPIKGHEIAMRFMAGLLKKWPEKLKKPRLHIIGEPANLSEKDIKKWAVKYQLSIGKDVVLSIKRVQNIAPILSKSLLGFIPSIGSEIICRVAHEFLLCGTPIVVSGAGSLEDAVFEGHGVSYGKLDEEEAIKVFTKFAEFCFIENENIRKSRAEFAKDKFSLEKMGDLLLSFILPTLRVD